MKLHYWLIIWDTIKNFILIINFSLINWKVHCLIVLSIKEMFFIKVKLIELLKYVIVKINNCQVQLIKIIFNT